MPPQLGLCEDLSRDRDSTPELNNVTRATLSATNPSPDVKDYPNEPFWALESLTFAIS